MKFPGHRSKLFPLNLSIIFLTLLFASATENVGSKVGRAAASESEEVTETQTLTSPVLRTWQVNTTWVSASETCNAVTPLARQDPPDGQVIVGYIHLQDHYYKLIIDCDGQENTFFRGSLWFDLTPIATKAPPPRVFVTSATLNFKKIDSVARDNEGRVLTECKDKILIATEDWLKDGYTPFFPPGADPVPVTCGPTTVSGSALTADCSVDVRSTVNNWVAGKQDNFGFVMQGQSEATAAALHYNREVCETRYGAFSLTVTYKYDKAPSVLYVPPPTQGPPTILVSPALTGGRKNVALAANGGVASASSSATGYAAAGAIDGDEKGLNFGKDGYWSSASTSLPAWLEIAFSSNKAIGEIDVFTTQDNYPSPDQPTETMTFTKYGLRDFEVQYWNGSDWVTIPGGNVTGNSLVWRKFTFVAITTGRIRILTHGSPDGYSRLTEVEAWTK